MTAKKSTKKSTKKRLCYVIMPFSKHIGIDENEWTDVYETIFKPAIEGSGFGYHCDRSTITTGSFTKDIVENMKNAHVVLADITGFNGNVMWELGVRHTLSSRTIMVARNNATEKQVISDLSTYGVHFYENNGRAIAKFKKEIKEALKEFETNPNKLDSPVLEVIKAEDMILSSRDQKLKINKLKGLLTELIENLRIADKMLNDVYPVQNRQITFYRFQYTTIDELLITNYIVMKNIPLAFHNLKNWMLHANQSLNLVDGCISLNKSDKDRARAVKQAKTHIQKVQSKLKDLIDVTRGIILNLKTGTLEEEVEPEIVNYEKKYEKLLDGL